MDSEILGILSVSAVLLALIAGFFGFSKGKTVGEAEAAKKSAEAVTEAHVVKTKVKKTNKELSDEELNKKTVID